MARQYSRHPLHAFGITEPADAAFARSYFTWAKRAGLSQKQVDEHLRWWHVNYANPNKPHDLENIVRNFQATFGDETARAVSGWFDHVDEHGPDAIRPKPDPSPEDDEGRAAEIDKIRRTNPQSYDAWLRQEAIDLEQRRIERQERAQAAEQVSHERSPSSHAAPTERKAEIEKVLRTDPGLYWGQGGKAMRDEYAALVEASMQPFEAGVPEPGGDNLTPAEGSDNE